MNILPKEYYHAGIQHIVIKHGVMIYKFATLREDLEDRVLGMYTNHPFMQEDLGEIMEMTAEMFPEGEPPMHVILHMDPSNGEVDAIGFCPDCVQSNLFAKDIHPENATDEELAETMYDLFQDALDGKNPHHHDED